MKRNAAIIGPTPAFLRWAIHHPCPLREIKPKNLPNSTFRQLRSLRELSESLIEKRVMDGIAFHPDTGADGPLLGFPVDETADAFGGLDLVQSHCGGCSANSLDAVGGWAGCFGLVKIVDLPAILQQVERTAAARDFYSQVQHRSDFGFKPGSKTGAGSKSKGPRHLGPERLWYGLWVNQIVTPAATEILRWFLDDLRDRSGEWESLCLAVERCVQHKMDLHIELHPTGVSDGQKWSLDPHCATCKAPRVAESGDACRVCGKELIEQAEKKRKVLGIRPYMHLEYIFGKQKCEELRERYMDREKEAEGREEI